MMEGIEYKLRMVHIGLCNTGLLQLSLLRFLHNSHQHVNEKCLPEYSPIMSPSSGEVLEPSLLVKP